jgi:hypothetical protein
MKTILIEALHRRVAIVGLQATWSAMVSSPEREEMGRRRAGGWEPAAGCRGEGGGAIGGGGILPFVNS